MAEALLLAPVLNLAALSYLIWIAVRLRAKTNQITVEVHEAIRRIEEKTDAQTAMLEQALTRKR